MTTEELLERITIDPAVCHGKPCLRHMRYPVEVILELLSAGTTDYEDLEGEDILAALAFAARLSQVKRLDVL